MCHFFFFWFINKSKIEVISFGTSPLFSIDHFALGGNITLENKLCKNNKGCNDSQTHELLTLCLVHLMIVFIFGPFK